MTDIEISEYFRSIGESYAAGLFAETDKGLFYRHCLGYAEWFKAAPPVSYVEGETLYPCFNRCFTEYVYEHNVYPQYCHGYGCDREWLKEKCTGKKGEEACAAMLSFYDMSRHPYGWLHGAPNYKRIITEGLDSYISRIEKLDCKNREEREFRDGLLLMTSAMREYADRCLKYLISVNAPEKLTDALAQVPFKPARNSYEALVCRNVIFYFDGCDNLGRIDDIPEALLDGEDNTEVLAQLFMNIDSVDMWSGTIGPVCNEITRQSLKAIKGKRRPLLELMVDENTPDDVWQLAYEALQTGCGNPSFYNDRGIKDMLHTRFPFIPEKDLGRFCGCGCTETNLEGITHAGGTDTDVNLLGCFSDYLRDNLPVKATYEEFFEGLCDSLVKETEDTLDRVDDLYAYMAKYLPHPMRTLLFDDCIDNKKDFAAGGARYNWTMNSESGLINVIDSLAAVKKLFYDEKRYTAEEFLTLLVSEDEKFFEELRACPAFGRDDDSVDLAGAELARRIFTVYREKKPKTEFLDGFTLTEHQFMRYRDCGLGIPATPDGRRRDLPTCDSMAAIRGKATAGPTAMLRSAAKLPQELVDGISVVNIAVSKSTFTSPVILKGLTRGYFSLGGIQLQYTVTSEDEMKDALVHPEKHEDLIVRVGGYTDYFNNLSRSLQTEIANRNIHSF